MCLFLLLKNVSICLYKEFNCNVGWSQKWPRELLLLDYHLARASMMNFTCATRINQLVDITAK